jgi:hypothetical protein
MWYFLPEQQYVQEERAVFTDGVYTQHKSI